MSRFRRSRSGEFSARFDALEAQVLRSMVAQVCELMTERASDVGGRPHAGPNDEPIFDGDDSAWSGGGVPGIEELERIVGSVMPDDVPAPEDPVVARLLPDAYRDDAEAAGEFRRLSEGTVRDAKLGAATAVLDTLPESGGRVRLTEEQAHLWLVALTDIRLALGIRLGITEETDYTSIDRRDPENQPLMVYAWLGLLQETLVEAVSG